VLSMGRGLAGGLAGSADSSMAVGAAYMILDTGSENIVTSMTVRSEAAESVDRNKYIVRTALLRLI